MRMLFDHVLLKPIKKEGTVLLPDKAEMPPEVGLVVSVGKGDGYGYAVEKFATTVLPGDTVFFLRDRAQKIELGEDKVEHFIVKEREVLGIFEKGEYI